MGFQCAYSVTLLTPAAAPPELLCRTFAEGDMVSRDQATITPFLSCPELVRA